MLRKRKMWFWPAPRSCSRRSSRSLESKIGVAAAGLLVLALSACQTTTIVNQPLAANQANTAAQARDWGDPDEPIILVAISGGGTRATALGYSVLHDLHALSYKGRNGATTLASRVKVVSSVSGGSVAAAYFGLVGEAGMDRIKPDFLVKDNMATLGWAVANPVTWFRLLFSRYTRIQILSKMFDDELFHGKTFAALNGPGQALIILNATDMAAGEVFAFTGPRFDDICSDLGKFPISAGVAASAAFPIALSPETLQDFRSGGCAAAPLNDWVTADLKHAATPYLNLEEYKRARYANDLRHGSDPVRDVKYLHLLDGGLADNQGVHSLMDAIISPHGPVNLLEQINEGRRKSVVVITINARSEKPNALDGSASAPGILSVLGSVTSVPIDAATANVNANLQVLEDELALAGQQAADAKTGNPHFAGLRVYGVEIDFDQFAPSQKALRDRVKKVDTSWTLSSDDLDATIEAGDKLLHQHPCFQRLLADLGVDDPGQPPSQKDYCRMVDIAASTRH